MPIARWNCCSWRCQCVTRTSSLEKLWYQCTKTPRSHRKKIPTLEILIQRNRIKKSPETTFSSQSAPCLKPISAGPCGGWCPEKNRPETGTFNIPHYKGHYMTTNPNFMPFFFREILQKSPYIWIVWSPQIGNFMTPALLNGDSKTANKNSLLTG